MLNIKDEILAIYCSPRNPSNSGRLLDSALESLLEAGVDVERLYIRELTIAPCDACGVCYDGSPCPIEDDMKDIYPKLENTGGILVASPVYFYGVPAGAKALIDRCQAFWVRRYMLDNPIPSGRAAGVIITAGSGGERVFEGSRLTIKYFLDSISIDMPPMLTVKSCDYRPPELPENEITRAIEYGKNLLKKIKERH